MTTTTFTVFYKVPGRFNSSTAVRATTKEEAANKVHGKFIDGLAVVTSVMRGE